MPGYQQARPCIERAFGWLKTIAGLRKVKLRGLTTVDALFVFASAASNIKRIVALRAGGGLRCDAWQARHGLSVSSSNERTLTVLGHDAWRAYPTEIERIVIRFSATF